MMVRRVMPSVLVVAALAACPADRAAPTAAPTGSTSSASIAAPSGSTQTPISSSAFPTGDVTAADLEAAYARFRATPPVIHGVVETRARNGDRSHIELWVDWPAFRIEETFEGQNVTGGELVIATEDGKRFGYRDPLSGDTGITRGFGEGAFVLGPVAQWFGEGGFQPCDGAESLKQDVILGRPAIHVGCSGAQGWDGWVDERTGLRLRYTVRHPDEIHEWFVGYVELGFAPVLDPSLFDPRSV
jgi:hypothetical protein